MSGGLFNRIKGIMRGTDVSDKSPEGARVGGETARGPVLGIHLCGGPECCTREEGIAAFEHLSARVGELNGAARCVRAACMGVCGNGPIAYVEPEGVWYSRMNEDNIDLVADEHLALGRVVESLAFEPPPDARPPA